jgi:hypothetical protein
MISLVEEALVSLVDEIECLLRRIDEKEHCVGIYTINPRQCLPTYTTSSSALILTE